MCYNSCRCLMYSRFIVNMQYDRVAKMSSMNALEASMTQTIPHAVQAPLFLLQPRCFIASKRWIARGVWEYHRRKPKQLQPAVKKWVTIPSLPWETHVISKPFKTYVYSFEAAWTNLSRIVQYRIQIYAPWSKTGRLPILGHGQKHIDMHGFIICFYIQIIQQ